MAEDAKWRALVLRLLSQLLIKTQAGRSWGASEEEVMALTDEADRLAAAYERAKGDPDATT